MGTDGYEEAYRVVDRDGMKRFLLSVKLDTGCFVWGSTFFLNGFILLIFFASIYFESYRDLKEVCHSVKFTVFVSLYLIRNFFVLREYR